MNEHQQKIAIAIACGWKFENYGPKTSPKLYWRVFSPDGRLTQRDFTGDDFRAVYVPNYTRSLDAMHDAEKHLDRHCLLVDYLQSLSRVLIAADLDSNWSFHATAAQRAEAFLRTLNLWKE